MAKIVKNADTKRIRCIECNTTIEFEIFDVKIKKQNNQYFIVCPVRTCKCDIHVPDSTIPQRWKGAIKETWL